MDVENIPPRIILLYMTNSDKLLHDDPLIDYPQSFYSIAHDQAFDLNIQLAKDGIYSTDF
jgi:hypothetical protein